MIVNINFTFPMAAISQFPTGNQHDTNTAHKTHMFIDRINGNLRTIGVVSGSSVEIAFHSVCRHDTEECCQINCSLSN